MAEAATAPFAFVHLTDLHLVPPGAPPLYGLDPAERLRAAVESIALRHGPGGPAPAAFAVATGDLTHEGRPEAYALLREILGGLPFPCHLLLGNHDERDAFRGAFPHAPVDAGGFIQQALDTPAGRFLLLDTKEPGTHAGRLCPTRLAWLADRLGEDGGGSADDARPVFLFMHHPPAASASRAWTSSRCSTPTALWEVLAPHRARVRHLFHGHLHRPFSGSWRGVPFSSLRGTSHQVALDLSERTAVLGSHEPPAYALVRIGADEVAVHVHDYLDETGIFDL
jgi:3',5'-cyclic AMP phosphodiesterase CpdA